LVEVKFHVQTRFRQSQFMSALFAFLFCHANLQSTVTVGRIPAYSASTLPLVYIPLAFPRSTESSITFSRTPRSFPKPRLHRRASTGP
jgi:hypothetical protein